MTSGIAHSDIFISPPPLLKMCFPSVEKVIHWQYTDSECLNIATVRRSESLHRRTWLSEDAETTKVPTEFTARALIWRVLPLQGSLTYCHVDVFHSRIVGSSVSPAERNRVPSGVHASERLSELIVALNFVMHSIDIVRGFTGLSESGLASWRDQSAY